MTQESTTTGPREAVTVRFEPELDMTMARKVEKRLEAAARTRPALIVLDLSNVAYVDSTIIATLLAFRERMKEQHTAVHVMSLERSEHLMRLFQMTGLDRHFSIHTSPESAYAVPH